MSGSYGVAKCKCSHSSCDTFKKAFYYLYPFNIEYSLFASALAYVMWKNVGRLVEDHGHLRVKFHPKDTCLGAAAGVLLVLAGLVIFIIYEVDMQQEDEVDKVEALLIYFIMNISILSLMLLTTLAGCVVYRLDHREHLSEKNPTRSLDVGLLVGASMGQFIISYFTIVAEVATGAGGYPNALNLSRAVLTVLQLGLQNYFIIEGLHREPFHAQVRQEQGETRTATENGTSRHSLAADPKKLDWKRRVLKEVCAFLLLANVIVSYRKLIWGLSHALLGPRGPRFCRVLCPRLKMHSVGKENPSGLWPSGTDEHIHVDPASVCSCGSCQPSALVPSLIILQR